MFDYTGVEKDQIDRLPESAQTQSTEAAQTPIVIGAFMASMLGLIGVTAFIIWRRYAQSRLTPERQARTLYWDARRSLAQLGVEAAGNATPAEFLQACAGYACSITRACRIACDK